MFPSAAPSVGATTPPLVAAPPPREQEEEQQVQEQRSAELSARLEALESQRRFLRSAEKAMASDDDDEQDE